MPFTSEDNREKRFEGNGSTTAFAWPNQLRAVGDLDVYLHVETTGVNTLQTYNTHYTIALASDFSSATVNMVTAPPATDELVLRYATPLTNAIDHQNYDGTPAEVLNEADDRSATRDLTLKAELDLAIKASPGTDFDGTLPSMAGKDGYGLVVADAGDGTSPRYSVDIGASVANDVTGPASATDNAVARFDGTTGKVIQDSNTTLSDAGDMTITGSVRAGGQVRSGENDTTAGVVVAFGDNANAGGTLRAHLGATNDSNIEYWDFIAGDSSDDNLQIFAGSTKVGAISRTGVLNAILGLEAGTDDTSQGTIKVYGNGANAGGTVRVYVGGNNDTTNDYYELRGGTTGVDNLELVRDDGTLVMAWNWNQAATAHGAFTINGTLTTGSGSNQITNAAGLIDATKINAGGQSNDDILFVTGGALGYGTITGLTVTPSTDFDANVPDSLVDEDLTIVAGTVDNTPIGATTQSTGGFTSIGILDQTSSAAANVNADDLLVGNSDVAGNNYGLTVFAGPSGYSCFFAGDDADSNIGRIQYNHSTDQWEIFANDIQTATIDDRAIKAHKLIAMADREDLELTGGVLPSPTSNYISVDSEGASGNDTCDTIGAPAVTPCRIHIRPLNGGRQQTFSDGTGNLALAGNFTTTSSHDRITLVYDPALSLWVEESRSNNA